MLGFLLLMGLGLAAQEIATLHPTDWIGDIACTDSLVFLGTVDAVLALSLPGGEVVGELHFPGWVQALAWDGRRFLAAGGWNALRVWLWPDGTLYWESSGFAAPLRALTFAPDGLLLGAAADGRVYAWDIEGKDLTWTLPAHPGPVWGIAASPASLFATAGSDRVAVWDISKRQGIQSFPGRAWDVAFSPDGFLLAAGMGKLLEVWDTAVWLPLWEAWAHESCTICVAFSPDGKLIASGSLDRTAKVWDAFSGETVLSLPTGSSILADVAFSPSGLLLAAAEDGTLTIVKLTLP